MSNWDNEKAPVRKVLLPEGWRNFKIETCEKTIAKASGNMMFKIGLLDEETQTITDTYAVAVQGKRWFLKQALDAAGVEKKEDINYNYSSALIGKSLSGRVEHEPNNYINKNNEEVKAFKHKIAEFKAYCSNPDMTTNPNDIQFEE